MELFFLSAQQINIIIFTDFTHRIKNKPATQAVGADPPEAPTIGKIHLFSKMTVIFEALMALMSK